MFASFEGVVIPDPEPVKSEPKEPDEPEESPTIEPIEIDDPAPPPTEEELEAMFGPKPKPIVITKLNGEKRTYE